MSVAFARRHIGPTSAEQQTMLDALGARDLEDLIAKAVPAKILSNAGLDLPPALSETEALQHLRRVMEQNVVARTFIGQGYYGTITPPVIQRNVLENPGWYTAYTPYQAEIAQGRLEALLNYQTMVCDLTGLDVSNASLLDEGTAAAEALALAMASHRRGTKCFVDASCHPQTIDVLQTRAEPLGIELIVGEWQTFSPKEIDGLVAAIIQYPDTHGQIHDLTDFAAAVKSAGALVICATDLLALTLITPPSAWGADIAVGSAQRFGVPMGFGGPHAGFIACADKLKRKLPGRLIGVTKDSHGDPAYRLSLQTREQHIRRDKATSNICTAQVLLAVMASMYAVYHGPDGLRDIARTINSHASRFAAAVSTSHELLSEHFFDTVAVRTGSSSDAIVSAAANAGMNLRREDGLVIISFDETTTDAEVDQLIEIFSSSPAEVSPTIPAQLARQSDFLTHSVFHSYHSETEMLRYLQRLESKDLALNRSMIPLGSCTMKLNATAEMMPVTWDSVSHLHPFAPAEQTTGYLQMLDQLGVWLADITGFAAVSLQPNAGSQGEYAGLLAIRRYHLSRGDADRTICLIPASAHGTNPASAVMTGFKVVPIACDEEGNIDVDDLGAKCVEHAEHLAALMVTYPSTHGVFEEAIINICDIVHQHGGQVYMDGANMNAQVGLTSPGHCGADVCHLNLHKTFCIPHGGGGPGVGPIGVAAHLAEFLPGHRELARQQDAVCSAPYGSASINVISWMYIAMMGARGLTEATQVAILSANYIAHRLEDAFPILYRGQNDLVAHECIIDVRDFASSAGVTVEDVAKRLMDYGYHAPTMSWPVTGTLMIEPTESESLAELDRFCDAMISIRSEIDGIIDGTLDREDNPLKNAPHTARALTADHWPHGYSRQQAGYPLPYLQNAKFWPAVGRVDNVAGDRNLVCTCSPVESYREE